MSAYYNEIDPYAAQWLRNLIKAGHIADGIVDERSIEDVCPSDLAGFNQCHFFAGVGVWSLALRRAGWPDELPVWTGSCPCQPFSSAGAGAGFEDSRHLWPTFAWLIKQCKPAVVFGEQVASKAVEPWVDLVHADMEAMDYAFGAVPFPSAGVGAPHIRDRLYWVADSNRQLGKQGRPIDRRRNPRSDAQPWSGPGGSSLPYGLGDPDSKSAGRNAGAAYAAEIEHGPLSGDGNGPRHASGSLLKRMANPDMPVTEQSSGQRPGPGEAQGWRALGQPYGCSSIPDPRTAGPVNGAWGAADWLRCRDDKWRPVEPGTFPLAHGATSRVGRLRAYGNAINAEAAREFIAAYLESI